MALGENIRNNGGATYDNEGVELPVGTKLVDDQDTWSVGVGSKLVEVRANESKLYEGLNLMEAWLTTSGHRYGGAWFDGTAYVFEPVELTDWETAYEMGLKGKQVSIFNLTRGEEYVFTEEDKSRMTA